MEAIANQTQEQNEYESEDALEVFENYSSIRRKMQEKKRPEDSDRSTIRRSSGSLKEVCKESCPC